MTKAKMLTNVAYRKLAIDNTETVVRLRVGQIVTVVATGIIHGKSVMYIKTDADEFATINATYAEVM